MKHFDEQRALLTVQFYSFFRGRAKQAK